MSAEHPKNRVDMPRTLPITLGVLLVMMICARTFLSGAFTPAATGPAKHLLQEPGTLESSAREASPAETVELTIDFGDGSTRHFPRLPWRTGITVADLWEQAARDDPQLGLNMEGAGASAFLHAIAGRVNGQPLSDDPSEPHYWQFWLNNTKSPIGMGNASVQPGDCVLWKFAPYD